MAETVARPTPDLDELEAVSDKTEKARQLYEALRGRRDRMITEYRLAGVPTEALQGSTGLSHQRISQILNRAGASTRKRRKANPDKPTVRSMEDLWDEWFAEQEGQGPTQV